MARTRRGQQFQGGFEVVKVSLREEASEWAAKVVAFAVPKRSEFAPDRLLTDAPWRT